MSKYNLSAYEKETIILFNNAEQEATVQSYDSRIIRLLKRAVKENPELVKVVSEEDEDGCFSVILPKSWVTLNLPRQYTAEEREKMEKRMAKMRAALEKKRKKEQKK